MISKHKFCLMWIMAGFIFVTSCSFCYAGKDQKVSKKQTIITAIKNAFDKRNYIELKDSIELFYSKYPNSSRNTEFKKLLIKMEMLALSEAMVVPEAVPYFLRGKNERIEKLGSIQCITLGMTRDRFVLVKGKPQKIYRHIGSWGVHEQWVYKTPKTSYFYFENGILTSWQD